MLLGEVQRMIFPTLVIVHGDAIRLSAFEGVHELAGPARVVSIRAAGNQEAVRIAVLAQIDGKLPVVIGIHFRPHPPAAAPRSEEHTSELQSLTNLVCR